MTIQEQLAALEAKRAASEAQMTAMMEKAATDGRTFEEDETETYDTLKAEVDKIDQHILRLKSHEKMQVAKAAAIAAGVGTDPARASQARGGITIVRSNLPPGTGFTRYAMALAACGGRRGEAMEYSKRWKDSSPEVEVILRAAVAAGTTTDADWAAPLVDYQNLASEFIGLLRPATIIGRIPGLRRVPFNVKVPTQTQGSTVAWVGQTKPKPVSELKFGQLTLGMAKAAGIVVLSEELVRSSNPSAEALVRADMIAQLAQFLDVQFLDPSVGEVANVSPASITNGITPIAASGTTADDLRADIRALFSAVITANQDPTTFVWVMTPTMALSISMMQNALGQPEFPTITMTGGTFFGLPVVVSQSVPANAGAGSPLVGAGDRIVLVNANDILLADDGQVVLDVSREASIQMDSAPDDPATAATVMVSLWQNNLVGLKAERFINWKRRRDTSVGYIDGANYGS